VHTARKYATTKDASIVWEGHKAGRDAPYCQIENLANLEKLPATGFTVVAFPVTVKGGSGGWTRAVAILD
jgi:kynurenine formamidase